MTMIESRTVLRGPRQKCLLGVFLLTDCVWNLEAVTSHDVSTGYCKALGSLTNPATLRTESTHCSWKNSKKHTAILTRLVCFFTKFLHKSQPGVSESKAAVCADPDNPPWVFYYSNFDPNGVISFEQAKAFIIYLLATFNATFNGCWFK